MNSDPPLRPVFWGALAFAAGIASGVSLKVPPLWAVLCGASAFGAGAVLSEPRNRIRAVCFALGWAALGCGALRARFLARETPFPPGEIRLLGQIVSFPASARGTDGAPRKRFRLKVLRVLGPGHSSGSSALWVNAPSVPLAYGDVLELRGRVLPAGRADFPGAWDDGWFLSVHGLSGRLLVRDPPQLRLLGPGSASFFLRETDALKQSVEDLVRRAVPDPESALVLALLLGEQDEIPFSVRDGFAKSGTAHLLAISGGNVALVVFVLTAALGALGFRPRAVSAAALPVLAAYCVLTGSPPSVVRAVVMAGFYLLGHLLRRDPDWVSAWSWSAIFILFWDPFQLFDIGFQLSYLSVLSIGLLVPVPEPEIPEKSSRVRRWVDSAFKAFQISWAAWIGVLPWTARFFFLCNPVAPLANLLAVPAAGALLGGSIALAALGPLHPALSETLGSACWGLARFSMELCDFFARLPGAWFRVAPPSVAACAAYYAALSWWIFGARRGWSTVRKAVPLIAVFAYLAGLRIFPPASEFFRIVFIDVGHGDCALLEFPSGARMLVDAGPGLFSGEALRTVAPLLWTRGVFRLDGVIVTHPHEDHYGGLKALLREFPVAAVLDNGDRSCPPYEAVVSGLRRIPLRAGASVRADPEIRVEVLHPGNESFYPGARTNDQSVVLLLRHGCVSVLLPGDAEESALEALSATVPRCDFLKVPHHGSDEKAAGRRFFERVRPRSAVISEGEWNRFGLPSPKTLAVLKELGIPFLQTGLDGAVEFSTDGRGMTVRSLRPPLQ